MKRYLALLASILITVSAHAQISLATSVWDEAAYGSLPGISFVKLQGWNAGITTTFEPVWPESAVYVPLLVALSSPYCASSDANDTSGGSGAKTISVTGVTTSYARFTETVTMNGQTSVVLATASILFIDKITVLTAGSGLKNAGIIQCGTGANTSGDPAVTHQYLGASSDTAVPASGAGFGNVSESFFYGVPANKTLICRNISCGSVFATAAAGHECVIDGFTNATGLMKRYFVQMQHNTGSNPAIYPGLVTFPEKTLIIGKMAGVTGSDVGPASMTAECLLIDLATSNTNQVVF